MASEETAKLRVKWQGQLIDVELPCDRTLAELKLHLSLQTNVQVARQKLLGLKVRGGASKGSRQLEDTVRLGELALRANQVVMMMGTPEKDIDLAPPDDLPALDDDLVSLDDLMAGRTLPLHEEQINLAKVRNRVDTYECKVLNAPRQGKAALVLDVDYTFYDLSSPTEDVKLCGRPHLHEFLAAAYEHYDIIIWSASSMRWIELKLTELGLFAHPRYRITLLMDYGAMITVACERYRSAVVKCKPLGVLWQKYPEHYRPSNTIMFDDLGRNFVMNPQNGLKIAPFKHALVNRDDNELLLLRHYLLEIIKLGDFSKLRHSRWRRFLAECDDIGDAIKQLL
jgi:ubiquitin-like domain-containing CTD phosphatase 1